MTALDVLAALLAWSLQSAIVVTAAALALGVARLQAPRVRLAAWQATAIVALGTPWLAAAVAPPSSTPAAAVFVPAVGAPSRLAATIDPHLPALVLLVIGSGQALGLLFLLRGSVRLRGWASRTPAATSPEFDAAAAEVGVSARLICAADTAPFTFGGRSPVVIVDPRVLGAPRTARAVFLHELTHVARGDWTAVVREEIVCRLLWFHPAAWFVAREMRAAREELVDRVAADRLGSRRVYLETLVALAPRGDHPGRVPALVHRHSLVRRVRALAAPEVQMSTRHVIGASTLVLFALGGAAYGAAATLPVRAASAAKSGAVERPVPTKKVDAVYPQDAKDKHVQGDVELEVTVGADGRVKDVSVTKSIPALDAAAIAAIRQWEFRPGRADGKAVDVACTITMAFRLK